jgi:hypothetical protein
MFKDQAKAIELCINRFDTDTKNAFMDLYTKMSQPKDETVETIVSSTAEEIPF